MAKEDKSELEQKVAEDPKLAHSESGVTTRDDVTDLGVPMLQGDAAEPVGPEDALGAGRPVATTRGVSGPRATSPTR